MTQLHKTETAGLLRRLMAGIYDWLLVIAIMMVVSIPLVAPANEAISAGNPFYQAGLLAVAAGFFAGFWSARGQTLGMRAWRLRIETADGQSVSFARAVLRFACACVSLAVLGLGFLWVLVSPDKLSWHDRWSGTRLRLLPRS